MASRKDFVQRKRNGSSASPSRPAAKPRAQKAAPPPPPKKKPWGLAFLSLAALAGLIYLLNSLINIDPNSPETVRAPTKSPDKTAVSTPTVPERTTQAAPPAPKPKAQPATTPKPVTPAKPEPVKVVEQSTTAEATDAPNRYEFYDLLPKTEITPAEVAAYKSTPRTAKLDKKYVLQAASFRTAADAEKMRAQLLLSGLKNVHTNKSDGSNGIWYRVRIGPFDNRSEMNKVHDKLTRLRISPMTIAID
ncbi:SPOR domain-containing protein [Neptunomonas phycophila]|uniref:SPOR domain-containing protein n=1 Tax=Neptunomonas phycophila TaxID=1572645 RepID=UPI0026E271EB|nr:SPOR domain-containing protein [Neptunomonas phycophila]MDO6468019.1 SPOR domain-containing protein [Neptunomonas phycophila]